MESQKKKTPNHVTSCWVHRRLVCCAVRKLQHGVNRADAPELVLPLQCRECFHVSTPLMQPATQFQPTTNQVAYGMLSGFEAHNVLWQMKAGRQRRQRRWPWEGWLPDIMLTPKFSFFSLRQHSKEHVPQPGYALCKIFATLGLYLGHMSLCCACLVLADRKALR